MEDEDNPEYLPEVILPQVPAVGPDNSIQEFLQADAVRSEVLLQQLYNAIPQATSIHSLCKLSDTTFRAMESRRKLLLKDYGAPNKGKSDGIVDPLD